MKTSLNKIKTLIPDSDRSALLADLNKSTDDDDDLEMTDILRVIGIKQSARALLSFTFEDNLDFLAKLAENVLPIYEADNSSLAPANAIAGMRLFEKGQITAKELADLADLVAPVVPMLATNSENSSTAGWCILFAARGDSASAFDAYTACRCLVDFQQGDKPNQAYDRSFDDVEALLVDKLNGIKL